MPTQQRKDRRQKDLLEAGRRTLKFISEAKATRELSDSALAKALDRNMILEKTLKDVSCKLDDALTSVRDSKHTLNRIRVEFKVLSDANQEYVERIEQLEQDLAATTKELEKIKEQDHDARKLRRRLREAKEKNEILRTQVNRVRRSEAC